ncbi:hypothetical protein [Archangium sp.]|uniref:hypothetical protein n=1 Tax=Archangium sp. TaxID=1872627 RepID=UPI002EDA7D37
MKMHWMAVTVVALMAAACGGVVEESTYAQAQHANVQPVAGASLDNGGGADQDTAQPPAVHQLIPPCGGIECPPETYCCGDARCCELR